MKEEVNWGCFSEGWQAWNSYFESNWNNKPSNPYEKESLKWRSWNKGYNLNTKEVEVKSSGFCESCGGRNCIC